MEIYPIEIYNPNPAYFELRVQWFTRELDEIIWRSTKFELPPKLLDVRRSAFLPEIFSFGPHRHQRYDDHGMNDCLKMRFLASCVGKARERLFSNIDEDESQSRLVARLTKIYQRTPSNCPDVQDMMVLDGYFIVELLRWYNEFMTAHDEGKLLDARGTKSDSPISEQRWLLPSLQRDLIKLENQFPFSNLEKFFSILTSESDEPSSLHLQDLFVTFFCSMFSLNKSIYKLDPTRNYAHPLDLFRSLFISSMRKKQEGNEVHKIFIDNPKLIYSAQDLHEAGVAFIRKENSTLLDISFDFDKGVMQIPPLSIDESMIVALLNFVAYEQCDLSKKPYFTNYLLFLDSLINITKDVEILRKSQIIRYPLGTAEVVDLFNNFCKGMLYSFDQTYLSVDMKVVNSYCEAFYNSKWRFWWSNLKRERFSSPWTFLSLVAAIVLLALTLLQTVFTVFPYYHPH